MPVPQAEATSMTLSSMLHTLSRSWQMPVLAAVSMGHSSSLGPLLWALEAMLV